MYFFFHFPIFTQFARTNRFQICGDTKCVQCGCRSLYWIHGVQNENRKKKHLHMNLFHFDYIFTGTCKNGYQNIKSISFELFLLLL